jgi:NADPH:quinone reductase-like Zn-dependent oxidoreductase
LTVAATDRGETLLTGLIADQAALYGVLRKVRDLGMPLMAVTCAAGPQTGALSADVISAGEAHMMQAVICPKYGPPDVLQVREVARPVPKENELLVKVHAATVGPADIAFLRADPFIVRFFSGFFKPKMPIPGTSFAGRVEEVGAGVRQFQRGDPVFGSTVMAQSSFADYLCVPADGAVAIVPPNISYVQAAGICDGGTTALTFLRDKAHVRSGQRVLINGASGAVGTWAVQLAKHYGAEVTGVCSGANAALVQALGADQVVDYTQEDFTRSGQSWDVIFDAVGKSSFSRCKRVLTAQGVYLMTVPTAAIMVQAAWTARSSGKKAIFAATGLTLTRERLDYLAKLLAEGKVRPVIDRSYSLAEVVEACRYVEKGHKKGDVVLAMMGEGDGLRGEVQQEMMA